MIHILTLHFTTPAWFEIQKRHILKYTNKNEYKLWLGKYNLELPEDFEIPENWEIIDLDEVYPKEGGNEHYLQVEWMYENCLKDNMEDDDIVVFIDSDAFPCCHSWAPRVKDVLLAIDDEEAKAGAICTYLKENRGIAQPDNYFPYPDLCFFATTKKVRRENNLEWGLFNPLHENPGFGMLDRLRAAELKIAVQIRTNIFNAHNVMFGVYGNMIYHQACGSRAIIGRPLQTGGIGRSGYGNDGSAPNNSRQCYTGLDLRHRSLLGNWFQAEFEKECTDIIETNTQIFDIIYDKLQEDQNCEFVRRYFLGRP
jgi:hypothetical protein